MTLVVDTIYASILHLYSTMKMRVRLRFYKIYLITNVSLIYNAAFS